MNLSENCKVVLAKAGQATATTAVATDVIDMSGYREIMFIGSIATKDAANFVNLQEDSTSTGGTLEDLAGTKMAAGENYFKTGLIMPRKRYVALKVTRGVTTATGDIWAILFKGRTGAVESASTVLKEETHISPVAGTA